MKRNKNSSDINFSFLFYTLIPRPWDLFAKGLHFWYGFLFGFFILNKGLYANPYFLNPSFLATNIYIGATPIWCKLLILGLAFFILEEVFLQQAKLLWDDIYDIERDKKLPLNSTRALSSGYISLKSAKINIVLRLIFAFSFGYLLGGNLIIILFSFILFHQGIYMFWGKPTIQKHPLLVLSVLSLNTTLRFITGVIVIANYSWVTPITLFTIVVIYLESFSTLSFFWRVEADYLINIGKSDFIRPQSQYFLKNGRKIQNISLILVDLTILIWCFEDGRFNNFSWEMGLQVFLSAPLLILLLLLTYTLFKRPMPNMNQLFSILTKYFFSAAIFLLLLALTLSEITISLYGFFLYNLARMLAYENMDFLDYTVSRIKKQVISSLKFQ